MEINGKPKMLMQKQLGSRQRKRNKYCSLRKPCYPVPMQGNGNQSELEIVIVCFFKNGPTPASFSFMFGLFEQAVLKFLQQINVKNVHLVSGAGIRTHNLLITSLLP